ncbi:transposase [Desulfurivibrio dismutans]|uniref:transposase n=1 Tax=Desulfurivibrio dismutans TaxID=1398908 RepID=UPI0023DCE3BB|nr:transposase [Desulfurivibrio alkaliphilus]MDF1614057.1 transposase [Desulfurivibrio alkaliphilus]
MHWTDTAAVYHNPASGMVIYKSKPTPSRSKGGRRNFQVFSATEFIAAITQHIPEKSFQLVRYYGWYSNRGRGVGQTARPMPPPSLHPQRRPPGSLRRSGAADHGRGRDQGGQDHRLR